MAEIIRMPKLSDTMTEGVVAEWHKNIGDEVESGELLAEIETDKATMEFESFQDGVLLHIGVEKGNTAPVDSVLCVLGEKGEDIAELLSPCRRPCSGSGACTSSTSGTCSSSCCGQRPRQSVSFGQAFGRRARIELGLDSRFR